jgi:HD-GYP domain-containing protein (c-di-GMP phosphodiesterase class II)
MSFQSFTSFCPLIVHKSKTGVIIPTMADTLYSQFAQALREERPFIPVRLLSLEEGTVTGFSLFLQPANDAPPVLYCEATVPFTEKHRRRLLDHRVDTLYIEAGSEREYRRYLEDHLPDILCNDQCDTAEKSELLYVSAQGLVRDILHAPREQEGLKRCAGMVEQTMDFLFRNKAAFEHLLRASAADYYTPTHSVHVCVYGLMLAHRAQLGREDDMCDFGAGLLMHDLGKGQIHPDILNTAVPLSRHQWEQLRRHPLMGHQLLNRAGGLGSIGLDVVRHHHERLNGSGYPDRFAGHQLAPLVRAAAIADVFDALTTNRPFRKAYTTFEALKLMRTQMAEELDADLLRLFIEMMGNPTGE